MDTVIIPISSMCSWAFSVWERKCMSRAEPKQLATAGTSMSTVLRSLEEQGQTLQHKRSSGRTELQTFQSRQRFSNLQIPTPRKCSLVAVLRSDSELCLRFHRHAWNRALFPNRSSRGVASLCTRLHTVYPLRWRNLRMSWARSLNLVFSLAVRAS